MISIDNRYYGSPIRRFALRVLLLATAAAVGAVVYLQYAGCPDWLVRSACRRLSRGRFLVKAGDIGFENFSRIAARNVRLYRKGVVGPPALTAERVGILVDWPSLVSRRECVKRVDVFGAAIRPRLAVSSERTAGKPGDVSLSLGLRKCEVPGLEIAELECRLDGDADRLIIADLKAALGKGDRFGEIRSEMTYHHDSAVLEGTGSTALDPGLLSDSFRETGLTGAAAVFDRLEFEAEQPRCEIDFSKVCRPNGSFHLRNRFWAGNFRYRGVEILRSDGTLVSDWSAEDGQTNSVLQIDPLFVTREDGRVMAELSLDFMESTVAFEGLSTIAPEALARMIGPFTAEFMHNFSFRGPVTFNAGGVIGTSDPALNRVHGTVQSRGLAVSKFKSEELRFILDTHGITNVVSNIKGKIWGGAITGERAVFMTPAGSRTNVSYEIDGALAGADFGRMVKDLNPETDRDYRGTLSCSGTVRGLMGTGHGRTANGAGSVKISDGRIFRLPLFGGLTDFMSRALPGLDLVLSQTDAEAEFRIGDGRIKADRATILGDVLSLSGEGEYYFDKRLNFNVQVKLMKNKTVLDRVVGTIWWPIGKMLEFRLRGTAEEPRWEPFRWPRELLERLKVVRGSESYTEGLPIEEGDDGP
ncbi:MAG: AsmA-like C-terminal region-containing protein [Kiritimatiellia bacterium]